MGTRHLIGVIDRKGTLKVAQYGQWDGYPSGQGVDVLKFAKNKALLAELEKKFDIIKFYNDTHEIDCWIKQYESRAEIESNTHISDQTRALMGRTDSDIYWWNTTQTRDLGADILENLIDIDIKRLPQEHNGYIYLFNEIEFLKDSLFCEWAYIIDLHTNKLLVLEGFNKDKSKEYQLCITKQEDVDKEFENRTKYYGCSLLKEFDLDNLPNEEEFLKECDQEEE